MKRHSVQKTNSGYKNQQWSLGRDNYSETRSCPAHNNQHQNHKAQPYISRGLNDISLDQFLPFLQKILPKGYEPLLKVARDDELLRTFRQRVAEAFCMGDKESFLNNNPLYPFCFVRITKAHYRSCGAHHFPYTLSDLLKIAKEIIKEGNNKFQA